MIKIKFKNGALSWSYLMIIIISLIAGAAILLLVIRVLNAAGPK